MAKSIAQMTAAEYKEYLNNAPAEEIKKLDEQPIPQGTVPTGTWRNGHWVSYAPGEIQKPQ